VILDTNGCDAWLGLPTARKVGRPVNTSAFELSP